MHDDSKDAIDESMEIAASRKDALERGLKNYYGQCKVHGRTVYNRIGGGCYLCRKIHNATLRDAAAANAKSKRSASYIPGSTKRETIDTARMNKNTLPNCYDGAVRSGQYFFYPAALCRNGHMDIRMLARLPGGSLCVTCYFESRARGAARVKERTENDPEYAEKRKAETREWITQNRARMGLYQARRRQHTPIRWHNSALEEELRIEASRRYAATGVKWYTDHIIPLNHPLICGLNVAENMQLLTATENHKKGNRWRHNWKRGDEAKTMREREAMIDAKLIDAPKTARAKKYMSHENLDGKALLEHMDALQKIGSASG